MYYEAWIEKASGGFGEYEQLKPNGDGWETEDDVIVEMRANIPEMFELGVDPLPERIDDIRGRIHNQDGRIFAAETDGYVSYFAVVEGPCQYCGTNGDHYCPHDIARD